jgi:PPIC-type PPIASE domain
MACGDTGQDSSIVRVAGGGITQATLNHWLTVLTGAGTTEPMDPRSQSLRRPVLSFLISAQWILDEAARQHLTATAIEADARLELLGYGEPETFNYNGLPGQAELPALFKSARSDADRVWLMKLAILAAKLEQRFVAAAEQQITPDAIAGYYATHHPQFTRPETRDVEWIVTYSKSLLAKSVGEIRAGKSFVSVAERVSQDKPVMYGMKRDNVERELAKHVFAAKPHVIVGPFRQSANHYVFEVTRITPARPQPFVASAAAIRRELAEKLVSAELPKMLEREWRPSTHCRQRYVVSSCSVPHEA